MISLKGQLPFRLGAPSYVFPADIVPNVRRLADYVDDIEIVLFESDAISPLPDGDSIRELAALARDKNLTYTVHLPLDADIGSRDAVRRQESVRKCLRVISRTNPLSPFGFVMHCPAPEERGDETVQSGWHAALSRSAEELAAAGVDLGTVSIETLDYPLRWLDEIISGFGFSVCLDVGHILLRGDEVGPVMDKYLECVRIVHLHGVADGRDHRSISAVDPDLLSLLLSRLCGEAGTERVLTIEVFSEKRLMDSLTLLAGLGL